MAYQIGFVPPFDNSFLYENKDYQKPNNPQYPPNSLFGYLQKNIQNGLLLYKKQVV